MPLALLASGGSDVAGQVTGLVVDERSGRSVADATVRILSAEGVRLGADVTDEVGRFELGAPGSGEYLLVAARTGYLTSAPTSVDLSDGTASAVLVLRPDPDQATVVPDTVGGGAMLVGRVLDAGSRRPIAGAEVVLTPSGRRAETRWDGRFLFEDVGTGAVTLSVRHPSFATLEKRFEVEADGAYRVSAPLREEPIALEGIEVEVTSRSVIRLHRDVVFRMNRDLGGVFFTGEDFASRGNPSVAQMLDGVASARVQRKCGFSAQCRPPWAKVEGDWRWWVELRGGCVPTIYIDGQPAVRPGEPQTQFLNLSTSQVEIVEIYHGPASLPPEYNDPGSLCAIGIWTKR